ncbi:MAG: dihydrolipoamide acetyltransferase family protein [Candidatus Dormibacteria bacterium]
MARDVLMPQMGYDMTEGTLVRWVKKVGDRVHRGDVVAEIETDKATVEIEAFDSGTLLRIIAEPGTTLPVGEPIATIGEPGEELSGVAAPAPAPAPAAPPPAGQPPTAPAVSSPQSTRPVAAPPEPEPDRAPAGDGERVLASPLARRLAGQLGVDIATLAGSGPGGRVIAADVEAAAEGDASAPAPTAVREESGTASAGDAAPAPSHQPPLPEGAEDTEPSRLRQTIARRMSQSKRDAPHFYVAVDIRADALLDLRKTLAAKKTMVSVNDLLVKALALAALEHLEVNAAYLDGTIRRFKTVDVGNAVATENGLLSPAIQDVGAKTLAEIAAATADLAERARSGRLKPDEYGGGTVTLSNLGMYGVDEFLAIINPPQALIVSVGAATERVIPVKSKPGIARVMTAWAAADHRVLDGAMVGQFLHTFRTIVEDPARLTS